MVHVLKIWLMSFVRLIYPCRCAMCGRVLEEGEEIICMKCNMNMPRTNFHHWTDNPVERMFFGKVRLERASSFLYYRKGSDVRNLLYKVKYKGYEELGVKMGRLIAAELSECGFFGGMDVIVPVPLHPDRLKLRGYNQSELIARGISEITGIPVDASSVLRIRPTETQTHKSVHERWENVNGIFCLHSPERFAGKHVLIIDDVLTTGATTTACADAFGEAEGVRISVLTMAVAGS